MPFRYALKRLKLLWALIKLRSEARTVELEIQKTFQELHDKRFENYLSHGEKDLELARIEGYCKGIEWCLKRFS